MHKKAIERIKARRDQGLTYRELGEEFGVSKTHAHRLKNKEEKNDKKD